MGIFFSPEISPRGSFPVYMPYDERSDCGGSGGCEDTEGLGMLQDHSCHNGGQAEHVEGAQPEKPVTQFFRQ